jgi:hypothetical protein
MTSVCQWRNGKCVYSRWVCVVCHSSWSLSSWVQGACLDHITSIKVVSRDYPTSHSLRSPHCWRVSQETQKWQARPGTSWPCGPIEGYLVFSKKKDFFSAKCLWSVWFHHPAPCTPLRHLLRRFSSTPPPRITKIHEVKLSTLPGSHDVHTGLLSQHPLYSLVGGKVVSNK